MLVELWSSGLIIIGAVTGSTRGLRKPAMISNSGIGTAEDECPCPFHAVSKERIFRAVKLVSVDAPPFYHAKIHTRPELLCTPSDPLPDK